MKTELVGFFAVAGFFCLSLITTLKHKRSSLIPKHTEPKHQLNCCYNPTLEGDEVDLEIIFIHGVNGHSFSTWTNSNGKGWFDWLPTSFPGTRIWSYGYNADPTLWSGSIANLEDHANTLLQCLGRDIGKRSKLVFICHSFGGLVAKAALVPQSALALSSRTVGVVFLATPHTSENMAKCLNIQIARPAPIIENLQRSSLKITSEFNQLNIPVLSIAEGIQMAHILSVVSRDASQMGSTNETFWVSDENHVSIAKPTTKDSMVYKGVVSFINNCRDDAQIAWKSLQKSLLKCSEFRIGNEMPLKEIAVEMLEYIKNQLENLAKGDLTLELQSRTWSKDKFRISYDRLLQLPTKTFDNVASDDLEQMWGDLSNGSFYYIGQKIIEGCIEMVRRSVQVRRLFIGERKELASIKYSLKNQQDKSIQVKFICLDNLSLSQRALPEDGYIVDGKLIQENPINEKWKQKRNGKRNIHIITDQHIVVARISDFEKAWAHASSDFDSLLPQQAL